MRREQLNCKSIEGGLHLGCFGAPHPTRLSQSLALPVPVFSIRMWYMTASFF